MFKEIIYFCGISLSTDAIHVGKKINNIYHITHIHYSLNICCDFGFILITRFAVESHQRNCGTYVEKRHLCGVSPQAGDETPWESGGILLLGTPVPRYVNPRKNDLLSSWINVIMRNYYIMPKKSNLSIPISRYLSLLYVWNKLKLPQMIWSDWLKWASCKGLFRWYSQLMSNRGVGGNYLSIPLLQQMRSWCLRMDQ